MAEEVRNEEFKVDGNDLLKKVMSSRIKAHLKDLLRYIWNGRWIIP